MMISLFVVFEPIELSSSSSMRSISGGRRLRAHFCYFQLKTAEHRLDDARADGLDPCGSTLDSLGKQGVVQAPDEAYLELSSKGMSPTACSRASHSARARSLCHWRSKAIRAGAPMDAERSRSPASARVRSVSASPSTGRDLAVSGYPSFRSEKPPRKRAHMADRSIIVVAVLFCLLFVGGSLQDRSEAQGQLSGIFALG